jgi:hypothetical protein
MNGRGFRARAISRRSTMLPQIIAFRAAMTRTGELAKPRATGEQR